MKLNQFWILIYNLQNSQIQIQVILLYKPFQFWKL